MASSANPFVLYTAATPNGHKISCHLEELKAHYDGVGYDMQVIEMSKLTQKEPWFINTLNPNGRIPVLVDRNRPTTTGAEGFAVFESGAIMLYLSQHYDKDYKFWFDPATEPEHYSEMLQWTFFGHGGVGPMQGQSNFFRNYAPEDVPYAKTRYLDETKRLYGVLEIRLDNRDWLAGPGRGRISVADLYIFPWVVIHEATGIENLDEWPNVKKWIETIDARPAIQAGRQAPPRLVKKLF